MSQIRQMNYCKICKKKILARVWKIHVMGKKHLFFTPKRITVSGAFSLDRVDEVHKYFSQFGTIDTKIVNSENGKISIDYIFQDRKTHSFIIYKEHRLFNQPVYITWDEVKGEFSGIQRSQTNIRQKKTQTITKPDSSVGRRNVNKSSDSKRNIIESLTGGENFSERIAFLQKRLQPDRNTIEENRKLIYDDLKLALAPMFALSKICFFGSSITGLDVQGSDLDVYIANVRENSKSEVQTLKLIRNLLFKCRKFCDVLLIAGAKIPIIKCIHTRTQICCDLNVRNKLSVCNSDLIRYYLSLDDKLRPLMIVIKFWTECYDLKKVNYFSSYALYMMVIFYLQQEPYGLPSVRDLQSACVPEIVDGWNCAFETKEFSNSNLKNAEIEDLVVGFFRFYSNFDYVTNVISPYFGSPIKKVCFLKPYDLPECFRNYENKKQPLYIVNSGICVQDPFEHDRNVSGAVPLQCIGKFTTMCKVCLEMIENQEQDLLYKLLTYKNVTDYTFEVERPIEATPNEWREKVKDLIEKLLSEVLRMRVVQSGQVYTCVSEQNIWEKRINILKYLLTQLPTDMSPLNREIAISKCIVKYFPQTLTTNMSINITFKPNMNNPSRVIIQMRPLNKKCKNFLHVCHYFAMCITKFLDSYSVEDKTVATPPRSELGENASETEPPSNDEMTQKEDKISEGNQFAENLSGKQDETENIDNTAREIHVPEQNNQEEEEEDVPADFFDDFSNQDFMDGLDIVDAWDDGPTVGAEKPLKKNHSPIRFIKSKSPPDRRSKRRRSKSRSPLRPKCSQSRRSRSREIIRMSDRRDPEKTRRDIHRDKIKVARDREKKLVNDKLRIVETGLVPPGTEMDVDLNAIIKEKRRTDEKLREREKELTRERDLAHQRCLVRERELKNEREGHYSKDRKKYSSSPRSRGRDSGTHSRLRASSRESNLSERELWVRSKKRTRSNSRSRSRKYEDSKKKKTFLEEIRDKLNETRTVVQSITPVPTVYAYNAPTTAPTPVPAPVQYFPPASAQQYDQNFFIGDAYQTPNVNFGMITPVLQMQPVLSPIRAPAPSFINTDQEKNNTLSDAMNKPKTEEKKEIEKSPIEDIDKLFADKKISLSDFLTITAKCEGAIFTKIRTRNRCLLQLLWII